MLNIEPDYMGRPLGGAAIICKRNSNLTYRELVIPSDRIVAVCISDKNGKPLQIILNVYMPFFNDSSHQTELFIETVDIMQGFLDQYAIIAPVKIVGDYNVQLPRCHDLSKNWHRSPGFNRHSAIMYDPGGGGALPLWESVGMRRDFAPHFRHLDDLFAPQNLTLSTILFRSCWVPFRSPPFSACRRSFCPPNWPNLSFYSDLVGSHFELRAVHPYWFWPGVPPPPPPPPPGCMTSLFRMTWLSWISYSNTNDQIYVFLL